MIQNSVSIIDVYHLLYSQVLDLRNRVLRAPLGLDIKDDDISDEVNQQIFVYVAENRVVGCLLLQHTDASTFKLRQMAVASDMQGKGIGSMLIEAAEIYSWQLGKKEIVLHARAYAMPFYLKLGYQKMGNRFEEVGIPHFKMIKQQAIR